MIILPTATADVLATVTVVLPRLALLVIGVL
jgi:hypothetical protein